MKTRGKRKRSGSEKTKVRRTRSRTDKEETTKENDSNEITTTGPDTKGNESNATTTTKVDSKDLKVTNYDRTFGQWKSVDGNGLGQTLLYIGAGWDMAFPFHRVNVLIDALPGVPHHKPGMNGYYPSFNMREVIHFQLRAIFPEDLAFAEDLARKRWCWSSVKRNVTIIYYYDFIFHHPPSIHPDNLVRIHSDLKSQTKAYDEQVLPPEVSTADVLYVCGSHPTGIEKYATNLKSYTVHNTIMRNWHRIVKELELKN